MIHMATQFVADFGASVDVPASQIWHPIHKADFVNFTHCDYDFSNTITAKILLSDPYKDYQDIWIKMQEP